MVSATVKDKNWFLPVQIRLMMIWLLELELVSFLGNCRPSPNVRVFCLQSSRILRWWSEPSSKRRKHGPPLQPFFSAPFFFHTGPMALCSGGSCLQCQALVAPVKSRPFSLKSPSCDSKTGVPCIPRPDPPSEALNVGSC